MPVEIDSFTTEVTLVDRDTPLSARQIESIVQEVFRRLDRKTRDDDRSERAASFEPSR